MQIAHGLSVEELEQQIDAVRQLNEEYAADGVDFRVFAGSEVDILADGSMDFPDKVLAQLDLVVASVHTGFNMTEAEATERVVKAVSNPYVDVLGHPTGRLLLRRKGYPLDHDAVLDACAEHGVAVELNASPWRLDVDWRWVRARARARRAGVHQPRRALGRGSGRDALGRRSGTEGRPHRRRLAHLQDRRRAGRLAERAPTVTGWQRAVGDFGALGARRARRRRTGQG